jgi:hypothetical protein
MRLEDNANPQHLCLSERNACRLAAAATSADDTLPIFFTSQTPLRDISRWDCQIGGSKSPSRTGRLVASRTRLGNPPWTRELQVLQQTASVAIVGYS